MLAQLTANIERAQSKASFIPPREFGCIAVSIRRGGLRCNNAAAIQAGPEPWSLANQSQDRIQAPTDANP